MVLARLLDPEDFGIVGMVTAIAGFFELFKSFGLSTATIQRVNISEAQISTLFWINMLVGIILALVLSAIAPLLSIFYHEPRLTEVAVVLALGFIFNAAGVQHSAMLQRQMRFIALSAIEFISLLGSAGVGIAMAVSGYRYWALVGMSLTYPAFYTASIWISTAWLPGMPRLSAEIRSMLRFGGTITLTSLVVYTAYNLEKVLLGRYWGADAIGLYGRAYQLISMPVDSLNSATAGVAFAALSRVQEDHARLKRYFLKGYSLVLSITIPMAILCTLFAREIIAVFLGPKWDDAVIIFQLLSPTILALSMINPFLWLLLSLGLAERSLKIAFVISPIVISCYLIGLPYGPQGVALGYSIGITIWIVPHIIWCIHGTSISFRDIVSIVSQPLLSSIVASIVPLTFHCYFKQLMAPLPILILGSIIFMAVYLLMLLLVFGQKVFYADIIRGLKGNHEMTEKA
jgi:O-antigen/teichoic acid export membrane protein